MTDILENCLDPKLVACSFQDFSSRESLKEKSSIRCVIFDCGQVLCRFDDMRACRTLAAWSNLTPEEIYRRIFSSAGLINQYERGEIASRDFYQLVAALIHADASPALTFERFTELWGDIFSPNPGVESVIQRIWPAIRRMILSNTNETHWEWVKKTLPVAEYFPESGWVLSFKARSRKPELAIYEEAIRRAGFPPSQIAYIDDKTAFLKVWRDLGGIGIHYDCAQHPLRVLEAELDRLGVLQPERISNG